MVTDDELRRARAVNIASVMPKDKPLKKTGSGYMTKCEFHDDTNPSMSLYQDDKGTWRFHCHACGQHGDPIQYVRIKQGMSFQDAVQYLIGEAKKSAPRPKVVAEYDYRDERGELLYQVLRKEPKDFLQRKPTATGWDYSIKDVRRVLYRLPELTAADPTKTVYYVEGEKDVETLRSLGYVATTHAGGAGAFRDELIKQVPAGRKIVVIPDADDPGRQLMRRVFAAARAASYPVGFVLIPDGCGAKDVSDWVKTKPIEELLKGEK